jgi:uncharacterized membrane protein YphA (DoxX/SURF4 family)
MEVIKATNLALRFLLELCALAALGYWGYQTGTGQVQKVAPAIGAPLLLAVISAWVVSPNAAVALPAPAPLLLGVALLELAAPALAATGRPTLAVVFGVIVVLNAGLMVAWGQEVGAAGGEP